jgi:hypothetical protein
LARGADFFDAAFAGFFAVGLVFSTKALVVVVVETGAAFSINAAFEASAFSALASLGLDLGGAVDADA